MKNTHDTRELVIARLSTLPENRKISIGHYGEMSKEEIIRHIQQNDEIGKKFVEIELAYLKKLVQGVIG